MVGPGHCPVSKYGPSLSKAVGPVDPSFLGVKKSHFKKNVHLTVCLQKLHVGCQYSKTCLKQPKIKKKRQTLTEIFGLWLIPAALELQYCGSRAATTCGSRAALKYFVCKLVFRLVVALLWLVGVA